MDFVPVGLFLSYRHLTKTALGCVVVDKIAHALSKTFMYLADGNTLERQMK